VTDLAPLQSLKSTRRIKGLTHPYYRYPAAASPELVREIILRFTSPGDTVLDPFMGGGTSLVEALAHGRRAVGIDINPLAALVARAKTTTPPPSAWGHLLAWAHSDPWAYDESPPITDPRLANLPPPIAASLFEATQSVLTLQRQDLRRLARCAVLRVGQWALESRDELPTSADLKSKLCEVVKDMREGNEALIASARTNGFARSTLERKRRVFRGRAEIWLRRLANTREAPFRLVLTSPPYPAVHALYHRWQINSRKETPAPYLAARSQDGLGPSYYTMGGRSHRGQERYFDHLGRTFTALRSVLDADAVVVQIVGFKSEDQLPRFLAVLRDCGFAQLSLEAGADQARQVPNRRWYARGANNGAGRELVLLHKPD
jgi:DNA modification methylase